MIDLDHQGRPALAAEAAPTKARGADRPHLVLAAGPDEILPWNARERHRWRPAEQLAGAAMAPAAIERSARQFEPHHAAQAAAARPRHFFLRLIDYQTGAPYIARADACIVARGLSRLPERTGI